MWKNRKTKTDMPRSIGKQSRESVESVRKKKRKAHKAVHYAVISTFCYSRKRFYQYTEWNKRTCYVVTTPASGRLRFSTESPARAVPPALGAHTPTPSSAQHELLDAPGGPFCVTRSNPTHQLTDLTQPNPLQVETFGPNRSQRNTTNKFDCLMQPNLI